MVEGGAVEREWYANLDHSVGCYEKTFRLWYLILCAVLKLLFVYCLCSRSAIRSCRQTE